MVTKVMTEPQDWYTAAQAVQADTVALRRAIHSEPELGLQTPKTLAKVRAALAGLPLEWKTGRSTTGAVAVLRGALPGRSVLLRGDMDALPMPEDTGLQFRSTVEGAMHACGHDTHTAMLASAARILCARRESLAGTVLFMFQPGEEGWHGARFMIDDGLLDDPAPEAAFALHIMPNAPAGSFVAKAGPMMASADKLIVRVTGKGGHASMPHHAIDPIPVACEIVTALQAFVTRRIDIFDPVVITVAKIDGGSTNNVIPETANLLGTIRTLSEETREAAHAGIARVAENVARAHECEAEVKIERGFPVTVCDARAVGVAEQAIGGLFGAGAWKTMTSPVMGAEDFSYVLNRVPGVMVFLGVCPEGQLWRSACPCHSNKMVLNEAMLARGVAAHCAIAERFLARGFG
ncbi:MAG TPA: M20 family metallopeptidase [Burkholderiales bacterium]|nr:M20 family metallopeptidase [Burkholderiales bacterium]